MIKDPYIGMPITIGTGAGTACSPAQPPRPEQPQMPEIQGNFDDMLLGNLPVAMAYVPMQRWNTTYSPQEALTRGTLFPELDLPFLGGMKK